MNIYKIVLGHTNTDIDIGATDELGRRLIGVDKNGWEEWLVLVEPDMNSAQQAYNFVRTLEIALSSSADEHGRVIVEAAFGGLL